MTDSDGAAFDLRYEPVEWLSTLSAPFAEQQKIESQSSLFGAGDPAHSCYFVQFGQLMVYRPLTPSEPAKPKAAIRLCEYGDVISLAAGDVYAASCIAIVDSAVLRIDRQWLERQAQLDPVLRRILFATRARENAWLNLARSPASGSTAPSSGPSSVMTPNG